jgi:hypothetical protein
VEGRKEFLHLPLDGCQEIRQYPQPVFDMFRPMLSINEMHTSEQYPLDRRNCLDSQPLVLATRPYYDLLISACDFLLCRYTKTMDISIHCITTKPKPCWMMELVPKDQKTTLSSPNFRSLASPVAKQNCLSNCYSISDTACETTINNKMASMGAPVRRRGTYHWTEFCFPDSQGGTSGLL